MTTFVAYIAPLKTLPAEVTTIKADINALKYEVNAIGRVQAVQSETLKVITDVAIDSKAMRRDVDDHTTQIELVKQHIQTLEQLVKH